MDRRYRPPRRLVRTIVASISIALVAGACAGRSGTPTGSTPAAAVRVTVRDNGGHISLHVGDHVILSLGPSGGGGSPSPMTPRWSLTAYPRDVFRLVSSDAVLGSFDLVAIAAGTGDLRAMARACGPPLPDQVGGPPCPVVGAIGAPIVPLRLFALTVTVS